ncbi:MAG: phenylalanine--tRNA ligase subunit beta [Acidobacteria bacterium]|nr:phenylalanine--tRNA ligase subunit beta [Acidobacteriota bacterium]
MKVLVSWLREFVDVPGSPDEIAQMMSVRGFAVEGIEFVNTDVSAGAAHPSDGPLGQHWPVGSHSDPTMAKADAVLDFEITANRPDCMSVLGMAREVATAYGLPLKTAGSPSRLRDGVQEGGPAGIDIVIENPDLCPRYAGAVADVTVGPSPGWMQARLQAAGVRPISNIVDVTNYVLLELGQPMHAFDLARLRGAQIRVRTARPDETIRTLDGQARDLSPEMLVIADAERPAAIAGVMGGAESEVTHGTRAIVFESAYFNPLSVRRTSRKLGLKTEASMRFERGADPGLPVAAMARATALLQAIGAGRMRGTVVDCYPTRLDPRVLRLRRTRIAGILGAAIPDADVRRILEGLGFALRDAVDGWEVDVPTRRVDAAREVDLIEEVARHYGFDRLPVTFPPLAAAPRPIDPRITRTRQLRAILTAAGFSEAVTFGFIAEAAAASFAAEGDVVPIANPLSENFAVLRPSSLPGLIDAVAYNRRRERRDVRLFEIGAHFSRAGGERGALACAWTGLAAYEHWSGSGRDVDFFDMKAVVERICEVVGVAVETTPHRAGWLVPGRSATVSVNGTRIGLLGQLTRDLTDAHGLPADPVYVADIDLDALDQAGAGRQIRVEPLPRYPSVTRDISVLVDDTLAAADVRTTIRDAAPPTLVRVIEFDRYQGKGIPGTKVSLSLRLTFRSSDRTLTDADVQTAMDQVLAALKDRHDAIQR